jgi:hypothetical protein
MIEEHLAEAEELLGNLPKRDQQTCTVFSPFSKRNVDSGTIKSHIEAIRKEGVPVEG